jgi:protein bicaudal C
MDVSHTEHSHVIGKGGNNIKKVMEETGCHIHFPDSNRNNQAEKSNQVFRLSTFAFWNEFQL